MSARELPAWLPRTWTDRETGTLYELRHAWAYRHGDGETQIGWVARYERHEAGEVAKQIIPFFRASKEPGRFLPGAPPAPRPLFGLHTLRPGFSAGPIFVTEGEKDAEALHRLGLSAVTSQGGGKAAGKSDWDPLREAVEAGRRVVIWPDDDEPGRRYAAAVERALNGCCACFAAPVPGTPDEKGAGAADWLGAALRHAGFDWHGLGPLPAGVSEDDLDALRRELLAVAETGAEPVPESWHGDPDAADGKAPATPTEPPVYVATERGIFHIRQSAHGPQQEQLSNFSVKILEEVGRDDGVDYAITVTVAGRCQGWDLPPVSLGIEPFLAMQWPAQSWGTRCVVWPGTGTRDRLRHAIQVLSQGDEGVPRRTVHAHTGWRERRDRGWVYLSAGCVIDQAGVVEGVEVDLGELGRLYGLERPSTSDKEKQEAAEASFRASGIAPPEVGVPLIAAVYLAPLAEALGIDFALWLEGPSRSRKSSLAAVMAAHFGAGIARTALTANWSDTATTIEGKLFALADTLVVIDDYAPQPAANAQAGLDRTVHQVIRNIGNRSARGRSRSDLSVRPERRPRALCLATAEQWPVGESIVARLFGVSLRPGQVVLQGLSEAQEAAREGLLARCMADFILEVAADYEGHVREARETWRAWRERALGEGLEGRLPEQVAFLMVGYANALGHWARGGLLDEADAAELEARAWTTLAGLARAHHQRVETAQPGEAFRDALADLLASGEVHLLAKTDGGVPENAERYGWKGGFARGAHIGWVSEADGLAYLLPTPTLQAVNDALRRAGAPLNLRPQALWRQLQDRGFLEAGNAEARGGATIQRSTRKVRVIAGFRNVLCFRLYELVGALEVGAEVA